MGGEAEGPLVLLLDRIHSPLSVRELTHQGFDLCLVSRRGTLSEIPQGSEGPEDRSLDRLDLSNLDITQASTSSTMMVVMRVRGGLPSSSPSASKDHRDRVEL